MKPDWSTAPGWANFLSMDEDGQWYWFELKPTLYLGRWDNMESKVKRAGETTIVAHQDSLEQRPEGVK